MDHDESIKELVKYGDFRYINVFSFNNLHIDESGLFLDQAEQVLEMMTGEKILKFTVLPNEKENFFSDVFVYYDTTLHTYNDEFIKSMVMQCFNGFGIMIGKNDE